MANIYDIGDAVRATVRFTDTSGTLVDPTTVVGKFKNPSNAITVYTYGVDSELVKSETGVYYMDIPVNAAGLWYYRYESTGTHIGAVEGYFKVRESEFD